LDYIGIALLRITSEGMESSSFTFSFVLIPKIFLSKWFYDTFIGEQYRCGSFVGRAQIAVELANRGYGGYQDLRGSGERSCIAVS
jgi:hypothetical protein